MAIKISKKIKGYSVGKPEAPVPPVVADAAATGGTGASGLPTL